MATAIVKLPLKLIVKPVLPVKTAEYKLTLDTNKPPANLNEIFPGKGYFRFCLWCLTPLSTIFQLYRREGYFNKN